jgi:hypothetical protein
MLKIVPEVDGRIAVLGRDGRNAVPGRVADAVCGRDPGAYVTAVPGREPLEPCDPMDLAVIGRSGIDAETGGPLGRTDKDDEPGGPPGALGTTSGDAALGGAVVKALFILGCEPAALEAEEGRRDAFDAVPVPGREGEREIPGCGVLLPEFIPRTSGGSLGRRSSPIMTRLIKTM